MNHSKDEQLLKDLEILAKEKGLDIRDELQEITKKIQSSKDIVSKVWKNVELARHSDRPRTLDFIEMIFDDFVELHGDRYFGDDLAMVGGIGFIDGIPVTVIGNQKGRNLKETIDRNGGMANPEGYRKALRLAKQAEKFNRPIITFIDTQGAYPGLGAEERGIGEAIALNLREFSQLKTPVICIIIGKVVLVEPSVSVLAIKFICSTMPSIQLFHRKVALLFCSVIQRAQKMLRLCSKLPVKKFGIEGCKRHYPEPVEGAHTNPQETANNIKQQI